MSENSVTASVVVASSEETQELGSSFEDSLHESQTLTTSNNSNLLQNLIQTQIVEQPLQILQTSDGATQILNAEALQTLEGIVILAAPSALEEAQNDDISEKIWQVVPTSGNTGITHIIAVGQSETPSVTVANDEESNSRDDEMDASTSLSSDTLASMLISSPIMNTKLPPDTPNWALKLRDCEIIGDSYRGWLGSEPELDLILTFHKQQTQSFWGTRQSPSSQRQSTRLMWKSQYVPFDGIPFINSGSRAIVMECQFGPRRKGNPNKKQCETKTEFRQTCPARIYIKKVTKYPEYAVDLNTDRKNLRTAMDKAFQDLKNRGLNGHGEDRWYVQLPTIGAHEFHDEKSCSKKTTTTVSYTEIKNTVTPEAGQSQNMRMHPKLVAKIRDLVQRGEDSVYEIRKKLRKYVEREMFESLEQIPERHNLCFFPTVHDIQNHVYQAIKDVQTGKLQLYSSKVQIDLGSEEENSSEQVPLGNVASTSLPKIETQLLWSNPNITSADETRKNSSQAMTVTFAQSEQDNGTISKLQNHLNNGRMQISTTLSPETAQLLSKLHPNMYGAGFIQLPDSSVLPGVLLTSHGSEVKSELYCVEKMQVDEHNFPSASVISQSPHLETTYTEIKIEKEEDENKNENKDGSIIVTVGEGGEILHIQSQTN